MKPYNYDYKPNWLPQVTAPLDFVTQKLSANNIKTNVADYQPQELKPLQTYVNKSVVNSIVDRGGCDAEKVVYISGDNEILDGHHVVYAHAILKKPIKCCKIYLDKNNAANELKTLNQMYEEMQHINEDEYITFDSAFKPVNEYSIEEKEDVYFFKDMPDNKEDNFDTLMSEYSVEKKDNSVDEDKIIPKEEGIKYTLYKSKPINTKINTGDFLSLHKKPKFVHEYVIHFENIFHVSQEAIESAGLKDNPPKYLFNLWFKGVDSKKDANMYGFTEDVYIAKKINQEASRLGIDGINYGDKIVQIINN